MVAQVACIHAQGFGINFVPLHHIVAKAPCIARGTMLKPGSSPGFFSFGCTRIFLFLDTKKRPKLLKFGRFVYIFVYVLRKTLIFKVYCGERGIRTPGGLTLNGFQDRRNRPLCHLSENPSGFSRTIFCISSAERTRFELVVENNPYDSLANCWFQPLTHLSSGSLLRVQRYIRYFSLPNFLGCFFAVIFHNICKSLSVSGGCGTLWLRSFAMRQILSMFAYASRQSRPNQVWMLCARFALSYGEK